VFLITSEGLVENVDEIKFYCAPRYAPNVLVGLRLFEWASPSSALSPIVAPGYRFAGAKGALPVDHTSTVKSVRAFKISNQFQS